MVMIDSKTECNYFFEKKDIAIQLVIWKQDNRTGGYI